MPATTRDLPGKTIFFVAFVSVMLFAAIVFAAEAGFYYFADRQTTRQYERGAAQTYEAYGLRLDNRELAELRTRQAGGLQQTMGGKIPIERAMELVAERY